MKNIGTINIEMPGIDGYIDYLSDSSLRDYDIVVFDPTFPYLSRIHFSGGGSCVDIEGGQKLKSAITHWRNEIIGALKSGKTIYVLLSRSTEESVATGYESPRKGQTNYNTSSVTNYRAIPIQIELRNASGRRIKVSRGEYFELYQSIKSITEYKVIINSPVTERVFLTNDNSEVVGGVIKLEEYTGNVVLLPHFDMSGMVEKHGKDTVWTDEALRISKRFAGQLIAIDKSLRSNVDRTPKPSWVETIPLPAFVADIDRDIAKISEEIHELQSSKKLKENEKEELLKYQALLYENGKALEAAIEDGLKLLGYKVENFRSDDLEIDHVIVGESGLRMIGESEGKDNSAIDIAKFRQLESNINEDFAREDVDIHAKGILFGNGYRLTEPSKRENEFTNKCLINAKRLGTSLVRTRDLYDVAVHVLDNPKDDEFKAKCRQAIESTEGDIVIFPPSR